MKTITSLGILLFLFTTAAFSQNLTQTLRGTIIDVDSKTPLFGVEVVIPGSNPLVGAVTDLNGMFRLENVPVGRTNLHLSYLGYENITIPNIVVNSGKEVILNLSMKESVMQMDEVVIKATKNKGEAINDMTLNSARSISLEESNRYAGSFNDPARILANFAGVTSTQDGSNDIIVRGNSPKYIQWRLEGVQIPHPNHFADQSAVSGAISILNNNLLATSDFYTGAFSPEFGDVLSGVYDVKLRAGNNERFESTFGFGLIGTDFTLEGPLKKGYGGSFLVNYRYSNTSIIEALGLIDVGGVPKFQDATVKIVLPTKRAGMFSFFGIGGLSDFAFEDVQPNLWETPGNRGMRADLTEDYEKGANLLSTGVNHTLTLTKSSFLKTTLSFSGNAITDDVIENRTFRITDNSGQFLRDSVSNGVLNFKSNLTRSTYRGAVTYNHKFNAKNKIQAGTKYGLFVYDFTQSRLQDDLSSRFTIVDFQENIGTLRNFISWKHRLNEDITIVTGVHNMNVLYNQKSTIEPRVALKWQLSPSSAVNAGYGKHSNMESIHNYFAKVEQADGSVVETNKDLDLLKAHHFVIGYEKRFTSKFMVKAEVYYQHLYNLPVENVDTSYYATINEGLEFRYVDLVNEGTGKNYGVEVTAERFFDKNYYYLINASLYSSTYKSLDGVERNTQYNGEYLVNFLAGKEFQGLGKKQNKTLALNVKIFYGGGKKYIPLLRDANGNLAVDPAKNQYWDYEKAYEDKLEDIYQVTLSASYKINRLKATHEIFLNLDNLTNTKGKISEFYDEGEPGNVGYTSQFGFFPNLMYRVYF